VRTRGDASVARAVLEASVRADLLFANCEGWISVENGTIHARFVRKARIEEAVEALARATRAARENAGESGAALERTIRSDPDRLARAACFATLARVHPDRARSLAETLRESHDAPLSVLA